MHCVCIQFKRVYLLYSSCKCIYPSCYTNYWNYLTSDLTLIHCSSLFEVRTYLTTSSKLRSSSYNCTDHGMGTCLGIVVMLTLDNIYDNNLYICPRLLWYLYVPQCALGLGTGPRLFHWIPGSIGTQITRYSYRLLNCLDPCPYMNICRYRRLRLLHSKIAVVSKSLCKSFIYQNNTIYS